MPDPIELHDVAVQVRRERLVGSQDSGEHGWLNRNGSAMFRHVAMSPTSLRNYGAFAATMVALDS